MVATVITPMSPKRAYADYPFDALDLDVTVSNGNSTDGNEWTARAGDRLHAMNTDDGAQTISVLSVPDVQGREGDISTYSIAAGKVIVLELDKLTGFVDGGIVHVDCSYTTVKFWVER